MSSQLLKKQLSSLAKTQNQPDPLSKVEKKVRKSKSEKKRAKRPQLLHPSQAQTQQEVYERNLAYFKRSMEQTTASKKATALMKQVSSTPS